MLFVLTLGSCFLTLDFLHLTKIPRFLHEPSKEKYHHLLANAV